MDKTQPTLKDIAEFFRLALVANVCDQAMVVRWVDHVIVSEGSVPFVFFDLSTSWSQPVSTMTSLLRDVPGQPAPNVPVYMLLGHCYTLVRSGNVPATQLLARLYKMAVPEHFPETVYHALLTMEDELWLACDKVYGAVEEVAARFCAYLSEFADHAPTVSSDAYC